MVFDSIKKKAQEILGDEAQTDGALDKVTDVISEKTDGKFDDQVAQGRAAVDGKVGDEYGAAKDATEPA